MAKDKKQISKTFYIPESLASQIEEAARSDDMSASQWMRKAAKKELAKNNNK